MPSFSPLFGIKNIRGGPVQKV